MNYHFVYVIWFLSVNPLRPVYNVYIASCIPRLNLVDQIFVASHNSTSQSPCKMVMTLPLHAELEIWINLIFSYIKSFLTYLYVKMACRIWTEVIITKNDLTWLINHVCWSIPIGKNQSIANSIKNVAHRPVRKFINITALVRKYILLHILEYKGK